MLAAKSNGGLGVGSIKALNIGLLVKWWWRLKNVSHSLWAQVISGIHNLWNKPGAYLSNQSCVGVWNNICRIKHALLEYGLDVHDIFNVVLESGQQTLFWYDQWLGSENLKTKYPTLFELETKKRCKVSERIVDSNHVWSWKSRPGDLGLDSAVFALTMDIIDIRLRTGLDH